MDEKQMTKGREAYRMMDEACNQLVQSGNWQRVGSSDIKLFLDMYVQALLLKMAQTTGEISGDMLTYIARVPARDILKIGQAAPQQALNIGFKNRSFAEGTPLLLRCCVAMDDKDGTATAQQFVDGVSRRRCGRRYERQRAEFHHRLRGRPAHVSDDPRRGAPL